VKKVAPRPLEGVTRFTTPAIDMNAHPFRHRARTRPPAVAYALAGALVAFGLSACGGGPSSDDANVDSPHRGGGSDERSEPALGAAEPDVSGAGTDKSEPAEGSSSSSDTGADESDGPKGESTSGGEDCEHPGDEGGSGDEEEHGSDEEEDEAGGGQAIGIRGDGDADGASPSGEERGDGGDETPLVEGGPSTEPLETPVSCTAPPEAVRRRALTLINAARAEARSCGSERFAAADAVSWNERLRDAAAAHSADMAEHNFFSHTGSDGGSLSQRVTASGYAWRRVGENIAAGQPDVATAVAGWLDSPGHCRNLMNPAFTEIALACVEDGGTDYTRYWTNVLATGR